MLSIQDYPQITFENKEKWRLFLDENHHKIPGIWMKLAKKASGIPSVTYAEALDEALCYGWIDGQRLAFDEKYYLQRFTPRSKKSNWSKINKEKVEKLIVDNRMQAAGQDAIENAKGNGEWNRN